MIRKGSIETDTAAMQVIEHQESFNSNFFRKILPHQFSIDGSTYEWMDTMYFKKVNEIMQEGSFGADALINTMPRNATIKTMGDETHFVTLSKANFAHSL